MPSTQKRKKLDFYELISRDRPTIAKFGATWCGPCRRIEPDYRKIKQKYDSIKFMSLDVDDQPKLADEYDIDSVPSFLVFKNGFLLKRVSSITELENAIKKFC